MDERHEDGDAVVIERIFEAPVDVVWRMWTEPGHFAAWYGPPGATVPLAEMDVRVGGTRLIGMQVPTPTGPRPLWFTGEYREVVEHRRLVYTESLCDETGRVLSPVEMGLPAAHPTETEVIVEFDGRGARTKLILTHVGVPAGSPGALGWNMALEELGARLAGSGGAVRPSRAGAEAR